MVALIRAIYHDGQLRLLDPVSLKEGEQVNITLQSERDLARSALSDVLVSYDETVDSAFDETALMLEIENAFRGQPPLSETIIQERQAQS